MIATRGARDDSLLQRTHSGSWWSKKCAPCAPSGREPKPKISLPIHLKGGGAGGRKKNERKFYGVVVVDSMLQKGFINIVQVQLPPILA